MKKFHFALSLWLIGAITLFSAVPPLINYQGLLLDDNGTVVNGTKNITLKVFDAATDGNEFYSETIGAVVVTDGLYAFNFGSGGTNVLQTTEIVGAGDSDQKIFNYTTQQTPILADTISITDGTRTWTESGGSSHGDFTANVNTTNGSVSAIYTTTAPSVGTEITITYKYNSTGLTAALSENNQAWLQLSIDGSALLPRQRLVSVPYAQVAHEAETVKNKLTEENLDLDDTAGDLLHLIAVMQTINGHQNDYFINAIFNNSYSNRSNVAEDNSTGNWANDSGVYGYTSQVENGGETIVNVTEKTQAASSWGQDTILQANGKLVQSVTCDIKNYVSTENTWGYYKAIFTYIDSTTAEGRGGWNGKDWGSYKSFNYHIGNPSQEFKTLRLWNPKPTKPVTSVKFQLNRAVGKNFKVLAAQIPGECKVEINLPSIDGEVLATRIDLLTWDKENTCRYSLSDGAFETPIVPGHVKNSYTLPNKPTKLTIYYGAANKLVQMRGYSLRLWK
ncbi:MAG: hypothetical protein CMI31_09235 [Opitutae bacterium]|nr:hypothetical protein [Opitutae bacterium]|tara:strand:- start:214 stop:1728 length:1515 start_codon:yes stop_codon:yes gene_type:complete